MLHLLTLLEELGVTWTRSERERRLFPLCVHVQAVLRQRHGPAYTTPDVSQVPDAYRAEAQEIVTDALFPQVG